MEETTNKDKQEPIVINIPAPEYEVSVKKIGDKIELTNQKLWDMAKLITDRQRKAKELTTDKVDWNMLEEEWFDWLKEELLGNENV